MGFFRSGRAGRAAGTRTPLVAQNICYFGYFATVKSGAYGSGSIGFSSKNDPDIMDLRTQAKQTMTRYEQIRFQRRSFDPPPKPRRDGRGSLVIGHRPSVIGHWSLAIGHWSLVIGHWSLVIGHWSSVIGHWSLVIGHWSLVIGH